MFKIAGTYFFCVSPARTWIFWICTAELESPNHHVDSLLSKEELESSHLNFSIRRSPTSFSVTRRKECVLLVVIFSCLYLDIKNILKHDVRLVIVCKLYIRLLACSVEGLLRHHRFHEARQSMQVPSPTGSFFPKNSSLADSEKLKKTNVAPM